MVTSLSAYHPWHKWSFGDPGGTAGASAEAYQGTSQINPTCQPRGQTWTIGFADGPTVPDPLFRDPQSGPAVPDPQYRPRDIQHADIPRPRRSPSTGRARRSRPGRHGLTRFADSLRDSAEIRRRNLRRDPGDAVSATVGITGDTPELRLHRGCRQRGLRSAAGDEIDESPRDHDRLEHLLILQQLGDLFIGPGRRFQIFAAGVGPERESGSAIFP